VSRSLGRSLPISSKERSVYAGADFVRHDLGVAILPSFVIPDHPDLRIVPIRGTDLQWTMCVATSSLRNVNSTTRALLALLDDPRANRTDVGHG
jgi:DNA-binding transcriptional LysR family regulator